MENKVYVTHKLLITWITLDHLNFLKSLLVTTFMYIHTLMTLNCFYTVNFIIQMLLYGEVYCRYEGMDGF